MNAHQDVYQRITDLIITRMQAGVVPWKQPWTSDTLPRNGISHRPYKGINHFLLLSLQNESPFYYSFQQVKTLGGNIKRGMKSVPVVFYKLLEKKEDSGENKKTPFLRYYNVFNLTQCEGIDPAKIPSSDPPNPNWNPIAKAEQLITEWEDCPVIKMNLNHAYYSPGLDLVGLPNPQSFFKPEEFYKTEFHECVHSTGHSKRLGRHEKMKNLQFGSHEYSQEELVAEMGGAFLAGLCGIENQTLPNSTAYIQSWIRTFKNDPKVLVIAASQASKAIDYILNNRVSREQIPAEEELILEPLEV